MKTRYPLIAYLDEDLTQKVKSIQSQLSDSTGSRGCLEAWEPHLTVGSEVWLENHEVDAYVGELRKAIAGMKPFSVTIRDFGFIDNWRGGKLPGNTPYAVYLKVVVAPELEKLVLALRSVSSRREIYYEMPWPYLPHVAVAYKDLSVGGYDLAKKLYQNKSFLETTMVSKFSLAQYDKGDDTNIRLVDFTIAS